MPSRAIKIKYFHIRTMKFGYVYNLSKKVLYVSKRAMKYYGHNLAFKFAYINNRFVKIARLCQYFAYVYNQSAMKDAYIFNRAIKFDFVFVPRLKFACFSPHSREKICLCQQNCHRKDADVHIVAMEASFVNNTALKTVCTSRQLSVGFCFFLNWCKKVGYVHNHTLNADFVYNRAV